MKIVYLSCEKCGGQLDLNLRVCKHCGVKFILEQCFETMQERPKVQNIWTTAFIISNWAYPYEASGHRR